MPYFGNMKFLFLARKKIDTPKSNTTISPKGMAPPGARYYGNELRRWLIIDPLADKYFRWSPYNYTLNNPLVFVDTDGNSIDNPALKAKAAEFRQNREELNEAWNNGDVLGIIIAGFNVFIDGIEKTMIEVAAMPTPTALVLTESTVENVVKSASAQYNSEISVGARHLAKKLGNAQSQGYKSAFDGI